MKNIQAILNAAKRTSEYVDLMRLPAANQDITRYATIKTTSKGPEVQDDGFTMLSPKMAKSDKIVSYGMTAFLPVVGLLGMINGMNSDNKSGRVFNYGASFIALSSSFYFLNKSRKYKQADTLIFPKVNK